jgi:uncharacterized protein DUF3307
MNILILLVWMHFVCDFILQNDKMALNKGKSNKWLTIHIAAYSTPFLIFGWRFTLANAVAHWCTDYVSSRITTKLWLAEKRHWFFVIIGADQALHMTVLVITIPLLGAPWTLWM